MQVRLVLAIITEGALWIMTRYRELLSFVTLAVLVIVAFSTIEVVFDISIENKAATKSQILEVSCLIWVKADKGFNNLMYDSNGDEVECK